MKQEEVVKKKRILYVDDDDRTREEVSKYLIEVSKDLKPEWVIDTALDGKEALKKLESPGHYDVMLLDLSMPVMNGVDLLEILSENGIKKPPIVVFSGALGVSFQEVVNKCYYLGASNVVKKPCPPQQLLGYISNAEQGFPASNIPINFLASTIDYMVNRREASLKAYLRSQIDQTSTFTDIGEPVFIVGRRWNSWYPSIFPVPGGAYAIVAPKSMDGGQPYEEGSMPSVIIDPGFKALEIFRSLDISVANVGCCIITHNHPDHIGGIFEFMAARHAIGKKTKAFFNPSTCNMLGDCSGFSLEVNELNEQHVDIVNSYHIKKSYLQIQAKGFGTFHEEIGRINSSKGLIITIKTGENIGNLEEKAEIAILGDTEYNNAYHKDAIVPNICKNNTKLVVLHIGSSQIKQSTGKHLYFKGLNDILIDINLHLRSIQYQGKLLIIVSEWGLEHATKQQLMAACGMSLKGFNDISPIIETIKLLQIGLEKIILLPADLGLRIGIETGSVYLQDDSKWSAWSANKIDFEATDNGILYKVKEEVTGEDIR
jgi:CheY-like chemotaxis protein